MKRHLFGFMSAGLAMVLIAGCKSDPQSSIAKTPASITTSSSFVTVFVADSQRVDAQIMDAQGTPLVELPTVKAAAGTPAASSDNPPVAAADTFSSAPVPQTSFWVKGLVFGTSSITVSGGGLSTTVGVRTIPNAAAVGAAPGDTILSGTSGTPYPIALDANRDSIGAPVDSFSWSVDNADRLSVDPVTGAYLAKLDGAAAITLTVAGGGTGTAPTIVIPDTTAAVTATPTSAVNLQYVTLDLPSTTPAVGANTVVYFSGLRSYGAAGRTKATVVSSAAHQIVVSVPKTLATDSTYDVVIESLGADDYTVMTRVTVTPPPAFAGTFDDNTPNTIQLVTATKSASGPLFDADTKVSVGGEPAFIDNVAPDGSTITFVIPPDLKPGDTEDVTFLQLGADQQARTGTVTINAAGTDPNGPADESTATAPLITADGNYYALLTSSDPDYSGLVGGVANFFTVTAGATDLNLTVTMDWDAPGVSEGDMDLYFCTGTCSSGSDGFGADGYGAASSSKPESESFTVPAGETWHIMLVRYSPAVSSGDLIKLNVTGF